MKVVNARPLLLSGAANRALTITHDVPRPLSLHHVAAMAWLADGAVCGELSSDLRCVAPHAAECIYHTVLGTSQRPSHFTRLSRRSSFAALPFGENSYSSPAPPVGRKLTFLSRLCVPAVHWLLPVVGHRSFSTAPIGKSA